MKTNRGLQLFLTSMILSFLSFIAFSIIVPFYSKGYSVETKNFDFSAHSQNYAYYDISFCSKPVCFDWHVGEFQGEN